MLVPPEPLTLLSGELSLPLLSQPVSNKLIHSAAADIRAKKFLFFIVVLQKRVKKSLSLITRLSGQKGCKNIFCAKKIAPSFFIYYY